MKCLTSRAQISGATLLIVSDHFQWFTTIIASTQQHNAPQSYTLHIAAAATSITHKYKSPRSTTTRQERNKTQTHVRGRPKAHASAITPVDCARVLMHTLKHLYLQTTNKINKHISKQGMDIARRSFDTTYTATKVGASLENDLHLYLCLHSRTHKQTYE